MGFPSPHHLEQFTEIPSCSRMAALAFSYVSIRLTHFPTSFSLHLGYLFLERGVGSGTSIGGNAFTRRWTSLVSHDEGTGVCGSQPHTPLLSKSDSSKDAALRALLRTTYFPFSQHNGGQRAPSRDDLFVKIANITIMTSNLKLTLIVTLIRTPGGRSNS